MMEKKKLCLVIPSLQAGGMERVMSELVGYFAAKSEIELHLILYGITREIFYSIPENIFVHKPAFRFNNKWRLYFTIKTLFFLRKTIKGINPSSILSFGEYWNNFVLLSVLELKIPAYVSDRSQPDKSLGRFHDRLRQWLYPTAAGLIFQTEKAREIFLANNKHNNIAVIGNPIRSFGSVKAPAERKKIVLMVGRLIKSKHQDLLIRMFAKINHPDWKLMIVGYDHLKQQHMERLKNLAIELNVKDRVIFTGKHDNPEELYLRSSVFAFTSSSEGFPNVLGEAMSAGLPVVAFDCVAGPSDMIIDGYNGFLISLFDTDRFELKLKQLMEDEELRERMGVNGKEEIKRFSRERICERFYEFVVKNPSKQ